MKYVFRLRHGVARQTAPCCCVGSCHSMTYIVLLYLKFVILHIWKRLKQ